MRLLIALAALVACSGAWAETYVCEDEAGVSKPQIFKRANDDVSFFSPRQEQNFDEGTLSFDREDFETIAETETYLQLMKYSDDVGNTGFMYVVYIDKEKLKYMSATFYGLSMTVRPITGVCQRV